MRKVTLELPDDVHEHAQHVGTFRHESAKAYLEDLLCAAVRRDLCDAMDEHDAPEITEDEGGGILLRERRGPHRGRER